MRLVPARAALLALIGAVSLQVILQLRVRVLTLTLFLVALSLWIYVARSVQLGLLGRRAVFGAAAAAIFVCVALPPATSKDVNSYAIYGRMVTTYDRSP